MNNSKYYFLNKLFQYSIIIFTLFITFNSKIYWYIIPISLLTISIILQKTNHKKQNYCLQNNINDPYLNLSDSSHSDICKINPKKFFNFNLYTNHNDLFLNKNLERQFYTMPNIFTPPNNKNFSHWLYNTVDNCKNNSDYCTPYKDTRFH